MHGQSTNNFFQQMCIHIKAVFRLGGQNTDSVAEGHCEGEGAGGGCAPSCAERKTETTSILQCEWEAKKRSIATIIVCTCSCYVALSMEKKFSSSGRGGG